jgi:Zn-dependent protease with chaperone function
VTQQQVIPSACPNCDAPLPDDAAGLPWCDACDWNDDPYPPAPPNPRLATHPAARGVGLDEGLLAAARETGGRGPWSAARVSAHLLAWTVHVATLGVVAGAVVLTTDSSLAALVRWFLGAILLLIAVAVFPRLPGLSRGARVLDRATAPALFGLLDEVGRAAGAPTPDAVVVDSQFNAWAAVVGWRRRRVIGIGRSLWVVSSPQERVALLGHELGHFAANDCRRTLVVASAMQSLSQWYRLIAPAASEESVAFHLAAMPHAARASAATYRVETEAGVALFNIGMAVPRKLLAGYFRLLATVAARASQRSEYRADSVAAHVASRDAAVSLLDRLFLHPVVDTWLSRVSRRKGSVSWRELVAEVEATPTRQVERLRRVGRRRRQRIDDSHPSHAARIDALMAMPDSSPAVTIGADVDAAVLKEILAGPSVAR